jgi:N6-L-threonylcarbamoyladenine synthase
METIIKSLGRNDVKLILGIESSCDETGVALYHSENGLLAHALHTQIALHREYGGVVPELASRDHIRRTLPLILEVANKAKCSLHDIDAIAYTQGPGLSGALLVGASVACGLAYALNIPALGIHHLEGHLLSPLLSTPAPEFPFVALLVSGGHTQLMRVDGVGQYTLLGETLDDAAGEAFDKSAKLLGLDYPGGPELAKLAIRGIPGRFKLPRPMLHSGDLDFSFSGLKTAVLTLVRQHDCIPHLNPLDKTTSHSAKPPEAAAKSLVMPPAGEETNESLRELEIIEQTRADIAQATQEAIVEVLIKKSLAALKQTGLCQLVVAGGVGANQRLRAQLNQSAKNSNFRVFYPDLEFCTDNGAMIAFAGAMRLQQQESKQDYRFNVKPRWDLQEMNTST